MSMYQLVRLSTWTMEVAPRVFSPPLAVGAGTLASALLGARATRMFSSAPAPRLSADFASTVLPMGCWACADAVVRNATAQPVTNSASRVPLNRMRGRPPLKVCPFYPASSRGLGQGAWRLRCLTALRPHHKPARMRASLIVLLIGCAASPPPVRGQTPEPLRLVTPEGHTGFVTAASFSHDGRWVVTASKDRSARVWEVATGRVIAVFDGHTAAVNSAAFSPDGRLVVTASNDGTARVWEAATGREVAALRGHRGWVKAAAFSPDGRRVVTAGNDSTARVWDVGAAGRGETARAGAVL